MHKSFVTIAGCPQFSSLNIDIIRYYKYYNENVGVQEITSKYAEIVKNTCSPEAVDRFKRGELCKLESQAPSNLKMDLSSPKFIKVMLH